MGDKYIRNGFCVGTRKGGNKKKIHNSVNNNTNDAMVLSGQSKAKINRIISNGLKLLELSGLELFVLQSIL